MNKVEFVVVQDIFLTETARFADVVLPGACFAEKDGVFTNSERRVQLVRKGVDAPGKARPDWEILVGIANAAGADWRYEHPREIYAEMAADAPKFKGISYEHIEELGHGIQWPCPDATHPGTTFLHEGGILRGKGLFEAVEYRPPIELPDESYPLLLSTGRTLYHYNAATQTTRAVGLSEKQPEAYIEIHPRDAHRREIEDGQIVRVSSRRGELTCRAIHSRQVKRGVVWMPFHFVSARANLLTNDVGDPITGTAEFKVCAVQIEKLAEQPTASQRAFPGNYFGVSCPER
jgi:formate dehydrogenase major subunit/formate dehydrogenase alpha subunit